jgi:hypothetical protein
MSRHNRSHAIFLSRQPLIILHSKLYSVCPSKYQDHSKPLKHLPINIWLATNTFMWLIPVVTGRDYFADLRVTKRNKATVLLTLTLFQTPTLTLTLEYKLGVELGQGP